MQRRLVDEVEELDVCSICHAEYAAGEEVASKFELKSFPTHMHLPPSFS